MSKSEAMNLMKNTDLAKRSDNLQNIKIFPHI